MDVSMQKNLSILNAQLDQLISEFIVEQLQGPDNDKGPKYMSGVISVLEELHVRTIVVTTMAFMQARNEGAATISGPLIKQFVSDCETDFTGNLRVNLMEALKNAGIHDDIFDVNAELRRELLNDNS